MIAASASPTPGADERQARQPQRRGAEDRVDHQGAGEDAKPTQAIDQPPPERDDQTDHQGRHGDDRSTISLLPRGCPALWSER